MPPIILSSSDDEFPPDIGTNSSLEIDTGLY
jgi:hypothetical protein